MTITQQKYYMSLIVEYPTEVKKLSPSLQCATQATMFSAYCFDLSNYSVFYSAYVSVERLVSIQ